MIICASEAAKDHPYRYKANSIIIDGFQCNGLSSDNRCRLGIAVFAVRDDANGDYEYNHAAVVIEHGFTCNRSRD